MGYETKIHLVNVHNFLKEYPKTGTEIFSLDLCKVGYDSPLAALISNTKPKEALFALWARPPEGQRQGVELLRSLAAGTEEDVQVKAYQLWEEAGCPCGRDREFWYQAQSELGTDFLAVQGYTAKEISKLSNELEDGMIVSDSYGDYLGIIDVDDFLAALKQELLVEDYRRYRWAVQLLESVITDWPNYKEDLKIITYGH